MTKREEKRRALLLGEKLKEEGKIKVDFEFFKYYFVEELNYIEVDVKATFKGLFVELELPKRSKIELIVEDLIKDLERETFWLRGKENKKSNYFVEIEIEKVKNRNLFNVRQDCEIKEDLTKRELISILNNYKTLENDIYQNPNLELRFEIK